MSHDIKYTHVNNTNTVLYLKFPLVGLNPTMSQLNNVSITYQ